MNKSEGGVCLACSGSGKCSMCDGKGSIVRSAITPIASISGPVRGRTTTERTCTRCYGSGVCQVCKGSKKSK